MQAPDPRTGTRYWKLRAQIRELERKFKDATESGQSDERVKLVLTIQELESEVNQLAGEIKESKLATYDSLHAQLTPAEQLLVRRSKHSTGISRIPSVAVIAGLFIMVVLLLTGLGSYIVFSGRATPTSVAVAATSTLASVVSVASAATSTSESATIILPTASAALAASGTPTPSSTATISPPSPLPPSPTVPAPIASFTPTPGPSILDIYVWPQRTQMAEARASAAAQLSRTPLRVSPSSTPTASAKTATPTTAGTPTWPLGRIKQREATIPLYLSSEGDDYHTSANRYSGRDVYLCRKTNNRWAIDLPDQPNLCNPPLGWVEAAMIEVQP